MRGLVIFLNSVLLPCVAMALKVDGPAPHVLLDETGDIGGFFILAVTGCIIRCMRK